MTRDSSHGDGRITHAMPLSRLRTFKDDCMAQGWEILSVSDPYDFTTKDGTEKRVTVTYRKALLEGGERFEQTGIHRQAES